MRLCMVENANPHCVGKRLVREKLLGPEIIQMTSEKIDLIRKRLQTAQSRQKSYYDNSRRKVEFEVGDMVHPGFSLDYYEPLKIKDNLTYEEVPIQILDRKDHVLRAKTISLVKVLWKNHTVEEASWEREDEMKSKYPELFVNEASTYK
ncbi:uncharacterized protein LOC136070285 [Quercus suber]|uniref:uncharacterized protein LOC136070285 n=1 Tax=Quercus suber TaxID=58331 RepID=UPI0032DF57E8